MLNKCCRRTCWTPTSLQCWNCQDPVCRVHSRVINVKHRDGTTGPRGTYRRRVCKGCLEDLKAMDAVRPWRKGAALPTLP